MVKEKKIAVVNVVTEEKAVEEPVTDTTDTLVDTGEVTAVFDGEGQGIDDRFSKVEKDILTLFSMLDRHVEHVSKLGPSTSPRRHNTYVVKEDGERVARIAKSELGNSGRYVEILSLNGITIGDTLKEGQVLDMPLQ